MSSTSVYSPIERLLHYVVFASPTVQKALCEMDTDLFGAQLAGIETRRELFVTGLPRSGTTLLLELLYGTGEFATFTYRHMPFVLSPLLWERLSRPFRRKGEKRERAHGDGMQVSFDSPEAFEEVIWLTYLQDAFVKRDRIAPLAADLAVGELEGVLRDTLRKLIRLESRSRTGPIRYLSKNNGNIARLGLIARLFPSATILVPFRHPLAHVSSLMRQHERFVQEHARDRFSRHYMRWLGHFEFGADFKPVDFDGWLGDNPPPRRPDIGFWLAYWTATYRHLLEQRPANAHLVDFDGLLRAATTGLGRLADLAGIDDRAALLAGADALRSPTSRPVDVAACPTEALRAAQELYDRLVEGAAV